MKKTVSLAIMAVLFAGVLPLIAQAVDISGKWDMTVEFPGGTHLQEILIEQSGSDITVKWISEGMEYKGTGTVKGDAVEWTMLDSHNGQEVKIPFTGTIAKGQPLSMSGEIVMPGDQKATWKAAHKA